MQIHLARRGRDFARYDVDALVRRGEGVSGAEIEQAIVEALYHAFGEGKELEQKHLELAIHETLPLSTTMKEDIARLREWARSRTRPASTPPDQPGPAAAGSRFA